MKKGKIYSIIFILILIGGIFYFFQYYLPRIAASQIENQESLVVVPTERQKIIEITPNSTFGELMAQASTSPAIINEIYESALDTYDLAKIKTGHFLELTFDKDTDEFKKLVYKIDSEDELVVSCKENLNETATSTEEGIDFYEVEIRPIDYEIKVVTKEGKVETSMYEAALANNIDERAIIELANTFQWSIDFAMDPRVGDIFRFIYEERYLDGEYQMPGKILAGQYINDGEKYQVYYFEETEENIGYFDENGNSVQKMFLKAPVAFKYISSGYTTGNRVIMEYGLSGPHLAIDYAAPIGTPIRAVGDGTVFFAGWKNGYGYFTSVRHNGTYTTNYAHQSKIAVRVGQKVVQGETIGYVGSTGYSTGPHLHYEMVKNGVKINPSTEILPPGEAIKEENQARFFEAIREWQEELGE